MVKDVRLHFFAVLGLFVSEFISIFINAYASRDLGFSDYSIILLMAIFILVRGAVTKKMSRVVSRENVLKIFIAYVILYAIFGVACMTSLVSGVPALIYLFRGLTGLFWVTVPAMFSYGHKLKDKAYGLSKFNLNVNVLNFLIATVCTWMLLYVDLKTLVLISSGLSLAIGMGLAGGYTKVNEWLRESFVEDKLVGEDSVGQDKEFSLRNLSRIQKTTLAVTCVNNSFSALNHTTFVLLILSLGGSYSDVALRHSIVSVSMIAFNLALPWLRFKIGVRASSNLAIVGIVPMLVYLTITENVYIAIALICITNICSALLLSMWNIKAQENTEQHLQGNFLGYVKGTADIISVVYYVAFALLTYLFGLKLSIIIVAVLYLSNFFIILRYRWGGK